MPTSLCPPGPPPNTDCPWVESVSVVVSPGGHNRAPHQACYMAEWLCHGPTGRGSQIRGTAQPHSGQCPFPHAAEAAQTPLLPGSSSEPVPSAKPVLRPQLTLMTSRRHSGIEG